MNKLILIIMVLLLRCQIPHGEIIPEKFYYSYNFNDNISSIDQFKSNTLLVKACEDFREDKGTNYSALNMIPLVPYGDSYYPKAEEVEFVNYRSEFDLPKNLKITLEKTNLFKKVRYTNNLKDFEADYELSCKIIKNSEFTRSTFYGIFFIPTILTKSIYGFLLNFLVFNSFETFEADIEVRIKSLENNNQIYGRKVNLKRKATYLSGFENTRMLQRFYHFQEAILDYYINDIIKEFKGKKK